MLACCACFGVKMARPRPRRDLNSHVASAANNNKNTFTHNHYHHRANMASSQSQIDALAADIDMSFEETQPTSEHASEEHPACPHISKEFEVEATRQSMQKKYKSAVVWGAQTGAHGARRKV